MLSKCHCLPWTGRKTKLKFYVNFDFGINQSYQHLNCGLQSILPSPQPNNIISHSTKEYLIFAYSYFPPGNFCVMCWAACRASESHLPLQRRLRCTLETGMEDKPFPHETQLPSCKEKGDILVWLQDRWHCLMLFWKWEVRKQLNECILTLLPSALLDLGSRNLRKEPCSLTNFGRNYKLNRVVLPSPSFFQTAVYVKCL